MLTERQYVSAVHSRLMDTQPWKLPGLQAVCRLAWALSLRVLSQLPQGSGKTSISITPQLPSSLVYNVRFSHFKTMLGFVP